MNNLVKEYKICPRTARLKGRLVESDQTFSIRFIVQASQTFSKMFLNFFNNSNVMHKMRRPHRGSVLNNRTNKSIK